jgi:hypothetical protein
MKIKNTWPGRFLAMTLLIAGTLSVSSCDKDDDDNNNQKNQPYTISGNSSGAQMVPSVAGNGSGTFNGTYNPSTGVMTYTTNWNNLTGAPTSGGFYSGASGTNGTAVGSPWTMQSDWTGTGSTTGSMNLTPAQANDMMNGNMYYSMGTAANSGGEIRGQMSATR